MFISSRFVLGTLSFSLDLFGHVIISLDLLGSVNKFPNVEELRLVRMRLSHVTFECDDLDFSGLKILNISSNLKIGSLGIENITLLLKDTPLLRTLEAVQITTTDDIFTPITKMLSEIDGQEIKTLKIMKNNLKGIDNKNQ